MIETHLPFDYSAWQPQHSGIDDAELIAALRLSAESDAAAANAMDVAKKVQEFSASFQAGEAECERAEAERVAEVARQMDPKQRTRYRHPLLLAMDKARTVNLSNKTESKSPEQVRVDDMVAFLADKGRR